MKKVLVIGDIIADVHENCTFRKMCPDAPKVQAVVHRSKDTWAGGAANVALNLAALSPDVRITLIGESDYNLCRLIKRASQNRIDMAYCEISDELPLTKTRIHVDGKLTLRLDADDRVTGYTAEQITNHLRDYLATNEPDLILLSDYGHETVSSESLAMLLSYKDRLLIDTKETDLSRFDGSLMCKLNQLEWDRVRRTETVPEQFFKYFVVTLGRNGSLLMMHQKLNGTQTRTDTLHARAHEVPTVDVCGCGDTFLAGLASSILRSGDPYTAICFAGAAAATVVTKPGTATADLAETYKLLELETERETR